MAEPRQLPFPHLTARRFGARRLPVLTDEDLFARTGVRVAFSGREGGQSAGPYAALNVGGHVGDDPRAVAANRALLLEALGGDAERLIVPNQVHGDEVVLAGDSSPEALDAVRKRAAEGADALVVTVPGVSALLCFADCVPVIAVSPSGRFAVAHAGWRGVVSGVAAKAVRVLARADADAGDAIGPGAFNVYVGPHIHAECFETGPDVRERFSSLFGSACIADEFHVDLLEALRIGLSGVGIDPARIEDAGACTACEHDRYFSYRASGGVCGRHGAVAFRKARCRT